MTPHSANHQLEFNNHCCHSPTLIPFPAWAASSKLCFFVIIFWNKVIVRSNGHHQAQNICR